MTTIGILIFLELLVLILAMVDISLTLGRISKSLERHEELQIDLLNQKEDMNRLLEEE